MPARSQFHNLDEKEYFILYLIESHSGLILSVDLGQLPVFSCGFGKKVSRRTYMLYRVR